MEPGSVFHSQPHDLAMTPEQMESLGWQLNPTTGRWSRRRGEIEGDDGRWYVRGWPGDGTRFTYSVFEPFQTLAEAEAHATAAEAAGWVQP